MRTHTITLYDIGNDIMHNLCDKMSELAFEIRKDHPEVAEALTKNRLMFGPLVNTLMDDSLCPTSKSDGKIRTGLQELIEKSRKKYENYYRGK